MVSMMRTKNALFVALTTLCLPFSGLVASAPTSDGAGKGGLSVPVTHNVNKARNGPLEMYKAFRKFNIEIPEALQNVVHRQQANKAATDGS